MPDAVVLAYLENPQNSERLRKLTLDFVASGALLVCADSGGEVALDWGLKPDLLVGDMDSINPQKLEQIRQLPSTKIIVHPVEKDETDLELAIWQALEAGAKDIAIIGGIGGRLDHTLGNLYLLAMPRLEEAGARTVIMAEREEIFLLRGPGEVEISGQNGDVISLFPFNGDALAVYTRDLYYPLRRETLFFGPSRGISNLMLGTKAGVGLEAGVLLIVHTLVSS